MPELGKIDREFFDIGPWASISEGTLLVTVPPEGADDVLAAFEAEDVPAADVGEVVEGTGLAVDGTETDYPENDLFWAPMEAHARYLE